MTKLLPCPFCGSNNIKLNIQNTPYGSIYWISCDECLISTDTTPNQEYVIKLWNTRHLHSTEQILEKTKSMKFGGEKLNYIEQDLIGLEVKPIYKKKENE